MAKFNCAALLLALALGTLLLNSSVVSRYVVVGLGVHRRFKVGIVQYDIGHPAECRLPNLFLLSHSHFLIYFI